MAPQLEHPRIAWLEIDLAEAALTDVLEALSLQIVRELFHGHVALAGSLHLAGCEFLLASSIHRISTIALELVQLLGLVSIGTLEYDVKLWPIDMPIILEHVHGIHCLVTFTLLDGSQYALDEVGLVGVHVNVIVLGIGPVLLN